MRSEQPSLATNLSRGPSFTRKLVWPSRTRIVTVIGRSCIVGAQSAVDGQLLGTMIRHASMTRAVGRLTIAMVGSTFRALLMALVGVATRLASRLHRTPARAIKAPSTTRNALEETLLAPWANRMHDNQASAPLRRMRRT